MRREFSTKVRVAAFQRCDGRCEKCGARLMPGKFAYDHILPDWLGGEPTLENAQVLCDPCHSEKTHGQDRPRINKTQRQHARHIEAKAPSRNPLPGSKASGWKRKMNGEWVRR